jgi:phospholipase/carboxylesterase
MSIFITGNTTAPTSMVIILHGYGANGEDIIDLGRELQSSFPDTIFIAPHAPNPCELSPLGYQWFSLSDWSPVAMDQGAKRAAPWINNFIDAQLNQYKIAPDRLVLSGFSQGAMMALYMALRYPQKIAGVLGYSGALLCADEWSSITVQKPPVCLVHGIGDNIVPVAAFYHAKQILEQHHFDIDAHALHGLMHGINAYGIDIGLTFLKRVLPPSQK